MTHQSRQSHQPIECPLASLGRNTSSSLMVNPVHHHPLSSSPLNPSVYQMSRESPILNLNQDDEILYTSSSSRQTNCADKDSPDGPSNIYDHLSRSSSSSADREAYQMQRLEQQPPLQHAKYRHQRSRNFTPIENLLQYRERAPSTYLLSNIPDDDDDDDDDDSCSDLLERERNGGGNINIINNGNPYFLEEKMDALYIQGHTIRGSERDTRTRSNNGRTERYFLEENLNNICDFNRNGGAEIRNAVTSQILDLPSSPSETSGSDRYLIDRSRKSASGMLHNVRNIYQNAGTLLEKRFHPAKSHQCFNEGLSNLGRFSPSLDQGYATLVSTSPSGHQTPQIQSPWTKKGPCRSGPGFDRLTDEVVLKIFEWLDSSELCNLTRVCRRFESLAWRTNLWKIIQLRGEHISGDKALKTIFRRLCGQTRNGACPDVERVLLSDGCRISDKGLQLLARRCPELTHLQIQSSVIVSNLALCDVLTKCTNLQHLDITGCAQIVSVNINPNLEPPRRLLLQFLDLTDCTSVDDVGLKIVVRNCPQLVYLYLRRCNQITDAGLKFVPSFCIGLRELSVSDCTSITDFGLYELAKLGATLRYLSVAKCDRVSDAGLKVIARRCYKLRYLNTRGCEAVSDDSITVLARSCPRLRALDIGKCDVSDAGLIALAESCPNLKKLSLRNCDMITDRGVQCIAYYCRGLQQLNIQDCQISLEGYRAVKKYCKRCTVSHSDITLT